MVDRPDSIIPVFKRLFAFMKFSISTLLVLVAIGAFACWMAVAMMPISGTGVLVDDVPLDSSCPLERLPLEATDVAYHYGGGRNPNTFYEFKIAEGDFLNWVASLPRFKDVSGEKDVAYRYSQRTGSPEFHQVTNGYFYEWNHPSDGDCGERIAYDKSNGRAYYQYHLF